MSKVYSSQQLRSDLKLQMVQVKDHVYYAAKLRGYSGYLITTDGIVISYCKGYNGRNRRYRAEPSIVRPQEKGGGYKKVILTTANGLKIQVSVHRLVAITFYEPCSYDRQGRQRTHVNHINANPSDNRLCNLELTTPYENSKWAKVLKECKDKDAA